jgi:hypothetical protein
MKKYSLSIHKSYLKNQIPYLSTNRKNFTKIIPGLAGGAGSTPLNIIQSNPIVGGSPAAGSRVLKPKTDRGYQLLNRSFLNFSLNTKNLSMNRLDLFLFVLKFTKSLSESKHIIQQEKVKVNGKLITSTNAVLKEFSIIECSHSASPYNYLSHEISNTIITPTSFHKIDDFSAIFYHNIDPKSILLPRGLNQGLTRRMTKK